MTTFGRMSVSTVALLTLAACGGGSTSGGTGVIVGADEEGLRLFADVDGDGIPDGDLVDLLEDGETVTARVVSTAAIREDFGDDDDPDGSNQLADATVAFTLDGDDLILSYRADGGPVIMKTIPNATSLDEDFYTDESDGFFDIFIGGRNTFAELLEGGRGYAVRGGFFNAEGDDNFGTNVRFVIGAETQDAAIDELGTNGTILAYDGFGSMNIRQDDAGFNTYNGNLGGDIGLVANFDSGTIFGAMDRIFYRERRNRVDGEWEFDEETDIDGAVIVFNPTTIQSGGFEGTMTSSTTLGEESEIAGAIADATTYSGTFFGPAAEEVGGSFVSEASVSGEGGSTGYVGFGNFLADSYVCCE